MLGAVKGKIILPILFIVVAGAIADSQSLAARVHCGLRIGVLRGVYLRGALAWWLPLVVMMATDIGLSVFYYHVNPLRPELLLNYTICLKPNPPMGKRVRQKRCHSGSWSSAVF